MAHSPIFTNPESPSLRMVAEILGHVSVFFADAGCPLTSEQLEVVADTQQHLGRP